MQNTTSKGPRRRPAYSVLIGIILLTIPCYLIGFGALFILQQNNPIAPAATATVAPTSTQTLPATPTLGALLPTQLAPPTITQPALPTATATAPLPTATATAVPIIEPSPSPSPTLTEVPTLIATEAPTPIP